MTKFLDIVPGQGLYQLWLFVRYFRRIGELAPEMHVQERASTAWRLAELMSSP